MKALIYTILLYIFVQGCCTAPDPVLPEMETPYGYDEIIVKSIPFYEDDDMLMATCWPPECSNSLSSFFNTDVRNIRLLKDSFPSCYYQCFRDPERFSEVDFTTHNIIFAYFGSSGQVIKSAFQYAIYVNHDTKSVLLKGVIVGSGSCAGSGLSSRSYERAFLLPKKLEYYQLIIESNGLR